MLLLDAHCRRKFIVTNRWPDTHFDELLTLADTTLQKPSALSERLGAIPVLSSAVRIGKGILSSLALSPNGRWTQM